MIAVNRSLGERSGGISWRVVRSVSDAPGTRPIVASNAGKPSNIARARSTEARVLFHMSRNSRFSLAKCSSFCTSASVNDGACGAIYTRSGASRSPEAFQSRWHILLLAQVSPAVEQPLIMFPRESGIGLYWQVLRLCTAAGFRPQVVKEVQELTTIIGLVDAGVGIAIVPTDTRSIHLPGVAYINLRDEQAFSTLYLAFRGGDPNPHLRGLLSELRAQGDAAP